MDGNEKKNEELENENVNDQTGQSGTGDNGGNDNDDNASGGDNGGKGEKSFSQAQVNRMMTREKNQGRAAAYKEMGIDPKDTKMVKMFQSFIASQKSDEQKTAEQEAANKEEQNKVMQRALMAEAKVSAMTLGVKAQYVDDAVAMVVAKIGLSEDGNTEDELKQVLGELKAKYPMWFGSDAEDDGNGKDGKGKKIGQRGTGSSIKNNAGGKDGKKDENAGLGARLAAQRKGGGKKTSYWS